MKAPTWEPGGDLARLAYCLGWVTTAPEFLVEIVTEEVGPVVCGVTGFGPTYVKVRRPNGTELTIPPMRVLEVREPEVQATCACGGEIAFHAVVDGPLYPQLCAVCIGAGQDDSDDRDGRLDR